MPSDTTPGYTTQDLAVRWRVSSDKIRAWILRGDLSAINTATHVGAKPRYIVTPDMLAEFERRRRATPPPKPARRRRKSTLHDYYPD